MFRYIEQLENRDCGFACLKMLLAISLKDSNFLFLPQILNDEAYSLLDLKVIAESLKCELLIYKTNNTYKNISFPCVVLIKSNQELHAVILRKKIFKHYLIYDPAKGIFFKKIKKFNEELSDVFIILLKGSKRLKCNLLAISKKAKIFRYLSYILHFLSFLSITLVFYFINSIMYLPIICIISYFVFEIAIAYFNRLMFKELDMNTLKLLKQKEKIDFKGFVENYLIFKRNFISTNVNFIISSMTILLIGMILMINNLFNYIILIVLILVKTFVYKLYSKYKAKVSLKLSKLEKSISKEENANKDYASSFISLNENSIKYMNCEIIYKYVQTIMIIISTFILMLMTDSMSLNFLIFHFLMYKILLDKIDDLFDYGKSKKEYRKSLARLNCYLYKN